MLDRPAGVGGQVEPTLLGYARTVDPDRLAVLARTVAACLDPDGLLVAEQDHERRPTVTLAVLPDGSGRLQAHLTAEAAAVWTTILDTLARPVPADDDQSDRRSPAQRRHDALLDAGRRLLRSGALPDCGGAPATVLVTLTVDQLQARTGLATAGHGGLISIPEALRIAAEADIVPRGGRRRRRGARLRADPPGRQYRAAAGAGRPRPGLLLPELRPAPGLV